MNYKIWIALMAVVFWSCGEETQLQSEEANFTEKALEICRDGNCPQIALSYPIFQGEGAEAESINQYINNYLKQNLSIGEDAPAQDVTLEEAAEGFVRIYQEHKAEYFDMTAEYEAIADITVSYSTPELLVLEMDQYTFTGGAHGFGTTQYSYFDAVTGTQLSMEEIIDPMDGFRDFAETKFREAYKLSEEQNINEPGFWFTDDQFSLPESMGMTDGSWILIYNPYEIAPYSEGTIEVEIPLKEVLPYLKIH